MSITDASADVAPGVRLRYLDTGEGARTAVLIHGFPQTAHEWRKLIPALTGAGFLLLALQHDHPWNVYLTSVLMGAGIGLAFASMARRWATPGGASVS